MKLIILKLSVFSFLFLYCSPSTMRPLTFINKIPILRRTEATSEIKTGKGVRCLWIDSNYSLYDLSKIGKAFDNKEDYNKEINIKGRDDLDGTIYFSFCDNLIMNKSYQALIITKKNNETLPIANKIENGNNMSFEKGINKPDGIVILDLAPISTSPYKTQYRIKCNEKADVLDNQEWEFKDDVFILNAMSQYACPKLNFYSVWNFIKKYKNIFAAIILILGLFEMFFGFYLEKVQTFIVTTLLTIIVLFVLIFQFILPNGGQNEAVMWVVLGISIIAGLVAGYFVVKFDKIIFGIIIGCAAGYFLGIFIFSFCLSTVTWEPHVVQWIVIIACMIILSIFSYFMFEIVLILCTAFIGSYLFIRGISLYAGGFPEETVLMDIVKRYEKEQLSQFLTWKAYAYFTAIVICCIIGCYVQFTLKAKQKRRGEDLGLKYKKVEN